MTAIAPFFPWLAGIFGAFIGSFLNVCIYRLPKDELSVWRPMWSFCPQCDARIQWYDNIPVVSWVLLAARCRRCRGSIAWRYPFVELLNAGAYVLVAILMTTPEGDGIPLALFHMALFSALIVVTFIDIDLRIIPDEISINGALLVPIAAYFMAGLPADPALPERVLSALRAMDDETPGGVATWVLLLAAIPGALVGMYLFRRFSPAWDGSRRTWWDTRLAGLVAGAVAFEVAGFFLVGEWASHKPALRLAASLFGMATGAGAIYAAGWFGKLAFRQDAMGFGDVKLMALLGGVLGWLYVLVAILIACVAGAVIGIVMRVVTRSSYIPFGPFLAFGAVLMILWPAEVLSLKDSYMAFCERQDPQVLFTGLGVIVAALIAALWFLRRSRTQS